MTPGCDKKTENNRLLNESTLQESIMQSIHSISSSPIQAWVWTQIQGRNGAILGSIAGVRTHHAFLAHRTTPPPMDRPIYNSRQYWNPWHRAYRQESLEERLTPLCGRIDSASRFPSLSTAYRRYLGECPGCLDRAAKAGITIHYIDDIHEADPWTKIPTRERQNTIDPVTGL